MDKKEQMKVPYEKPLVVTYSGDELVEEITFAQGCSPGPCPVP